MSTRTRFIALAIALAIVPATAHAQFGGLMKKAKEAVVQKGAEKAVDKAVDKAGPEAPGEQLTAETLGQVLRGAQAADRVLGERDRVQALRESKNKEYSALVEKNGPVHDAYNQASGKIEDCRSTSFSNLADARQEKANKRAEELKNDPALIGKMQLIGMKYGQRIAEAQQKQDPVALQNAQRDYFKELLGVDVFADLKKDSVATDAKCGKAPVRPASLVQEEKLQKEVAAADDSIRTLEAKAVNAGAQASGIEQVRYLQLKERAAAILAKLGGGSGKFGTAEMEAVKARQPELEKVKRAL